MVILELLEHLFYLAGSIIALIILVGAIAMMVLPIIFLVGLIL